jgi:solute carrier family 25 phosphate transporter 23/24/25/41
MQKREGFIGFFKGNGMTVMKIAPFSAFEFYFYEVFKNNLYGHKKQLGYFDKLISGGLTGIVASTLTYPFDIVKTYLTINVDNSKRLTMMQ